MTQKPSEREMEIASDLLDEIVKGVIKMSRVTLIERMDMSRDLQDSIVGALAKYRVEVLEEAAKVAEDFCDVPHSCNIHSEADRQLMLSIAKAIRQLGENQ